jgi:hypothetical protein
MEIESGKNLAHSSISNWISDSFVYVITPKDVVTAAQPRAKMNFGGKLCGEM